MRFRPQYKNLELGELSICLLFTAKHRNRFVGVGYECVCCMYTEIFFFKAALKFKFPTEFNFSSKRRAATIRLFYFHELHVAFFFFFFFPTKEAATPFVATTI